MLPCHLDPTTAIPTAQPPRPKPATAARHLQLPPLIPTRTACRLNHSCRPNATYHFLPSSGKVIARLVQDVAPGEEITICYLDALSNSLEKRQEQLLGSYGFECNCVRCNEERQLQHQWRGASEEEAGAWQQEKARKRRKREEQGAGKRDEEGLKAGGSWGEAAAAVAQAGELFLHQVGGPFFICRVDMCGNEKVSCDGQPAGGVGRRLCILAALSKPLDDQRP